AVRRSVPTRRSSDLGAEVEEDDAVVVGNDAIAVADHRLHELVGDPGGVGLGHRVHRVRILNALAVDHGVIGLLHPVPALVTVHGVVPAHHRCDLAHADLPALFHRLSHKALAAGGGYIPTVQKGVDIDLLHPPA